MSLRLAASFLTRVPLAPDPSTTPTMSAAVPWFPAVGFLLGLAQAAAYAGLQLILPATLAAALAVTALALVTGAFHHDGLADMADAFGGGWTVDQRLEILKDSRLGTYGVTALTLALLIEVTALSSLTAWTGAAAVICAHTISRAASSTAMLVGTPAKASGLGVDYLAALPRAKVGFSLLGAIGVAGVATGVWAAASMVAAAVATAMTVALATRKIGGISGDVLGAIQQLSKLAVLVTIVAVATGFSAGSVPLGGLLLNR